VRPSITLAPFKSFQDAVMARHWPDRLRCAIPCQQFQPGFPSVKCRPWHQGGPAREARAGEDRTTMTRQSGPDGGSCFHRTHDPLTQISGQRNWPGMPLGRPQPALWNRQSRFHATAARSKALRSHPLRDATKGNEAERNDQDHPISKARLFPSGIRGVYVNAHGCNSDRKCTLRNGRLRSFQDRGRKKAGPQGPAFSFGREVSTCSPCRWGSCCRRPSRSARDSSCSGRSRPHRWRSSVRA